MAQYAQVTEVEAQTVPSAHEGQQAPRWPRRAALVGAGIVLCGVAAVAASRLSEGASGAREARSGEAVGLAVDPFGGEAGPDFSAHDALIGSYPKFGNDWAARQGSPPIKMKPNPSPTCQSCQQTGGRCCGTSCCGADSVCCKESIGLCCSADSMCCEGELCCQPGFNCGRTRKFGGDLKYDVLKQCGPGASFRRLAAASEQETANLGRFLANETALKQMQLN